MYYKSIRNASIFSGLLIQIDNHQHQKPRQFHTHIPNNSKFSLIFAKKWIETFPIKNNKKPQCETKFFSKRNNIKQLYKKGFSRSFYNKFRVFVVSPILKCQIFRFIFWFCTSKCVFFTIISLNKFYNTNNFYCFFLFGRKNNFLLHLEIFILCRVLLFTLNKFLLKFFTIFLLRIFAEGRRWHESSL